MADEEKAEEYVRNAIKGYEKDFTECEVFSMITCYKDGLAEGRKESKEYIRYLKRQRQGGIQKQYNKIAKIKSLSKENKMCEEIIIGEQQEINRLEKENAELKEQIESYRNAVEKCRHIPYIGVGNEVCHTVVEYAQRVDGILFSVEGIDYWFKRLDK